MSFAILQSIDHRTLQGLFRGAFFAGCDAAGSSCITAAPERAAALVLQRLTLRS